MKLASITEEMRSIRFLRVRDVAIFVAINTVLLLILYAKFLRARSNNNESRAIGDTRSLISANATYASANCGLYAETLQCLTREGGEICIPDYPTNAPQFLGGEVARPSPYTKAGYWRHYEGFNVPEEIPSKCAPRSVQFYCYASWPMTHGVTGIRSFVGTPVGIYEDPDGGDTQCILQPTPAADEWEPPPNAYPIDSAYLAFRHNMIALAYWFREFWSHFWRIGLLLGGVVGAMAMVIGRLNRKTVIILFLISVLLAFHTSTCSSFMRV
jgi:hypothetical protein